MEVKYKIMEVFNGITKEFNFPKNKKAEAIAAYKNIRMRADRCRFFSIDSDDNDIWYDLSDKY